MESKFGRFSVLEKEIEKERTKAIKDGKNPDEAEAELRAKIERANARVREEK